MFCAGAHLKESKLMKEGDISMLVSKACICCFIVLVRFQSQQFVLEGAALGGGLEMALTCDFHVASTTAKLGLPETCYYTWWWRYCTFT